MKTVIKPNRAHLASAVARRTIGDGEPELYSREELKALIAAALICTRKLEYGRAKASAHDQATAFKRRFEIIQLFRGFPDTFRKHPTGQNTKKAVIKGLAKMDIPCSPRTLARDYKTLGGAKFLRAAVPFRLGESIKWKPKKAEHGRASRR